MPWTVMDWVALPGGLLRPMTWRSRMDVNSGISGKGNRDMMCNDAGLACLVSQALFGCHVQKSCLRTRLKYCK